MKIVLGWTIEKQIIPNRSCHELGPKIFLAYNRFKLGLRYGQVINDCLPISSTVNSYTS